MSRADADGLAARSAAGQLYVIDLPDGMLRPAAHVFVCDQGMAFADLGWHSAGVGGFTMHVLRGKVRPAGEGHLMVDMETGGQTEIMPLDNDYRAILRLPAGPLDPGPRDVARCGLDDQATGLGP